MSRGALGGKRSAIKGAASGLRSCSGERGTGGRGGAGPVRRRCGGIGGPAYADQVRVVGDEPGLAGQESGRQIGAISLSALKPAHVGPGFGIEVSAVPGLLNRFERDLSPGAQQPAVVGPSASSLWRTGKQQDGQSCLKKADKEASWHQQHHSA
jgi:hypothetical protein